ncbi:MAG TPA: hypothetical protein PKZ44_01335 [Flavobacterium sp.]|nr:hypothetical protein [Flavobacterium sp.]
MNINFNLETELNIFKENLSVFPEKKDYASLYDAHFKPSFNKFVHPEVKTKILEIEKTGYFNDHGVDHIKMVIERASWLMSCMNVSLEKKDGFFYISPYETFILLMSIHLHDTGHLIASRKEHARAGKEILAQFDSGNILSIAEKRVIGNIAQSHGGKKDPIGKLEPEISLSHQKIRPQLLAAILRLGDELAEDKTRASNFLLNTKNMERTSEIFHLYSASLDSLDLSNNEISLEFCFLDKISIKKYPKIIDFAEKEVYLIDEIYERTLKTFTEALYCNRFLPSECRFNRVKVNILILNEKDHEQIISIRYELKELLYPTVVMNNIYDICETLKAGDIEKNGQYICDEVKKIMENEKL